MSNLNGLPLLSGPPPAPSTGRAQNACRKCNKEFIILFARSTRCNHCGYLYCASCADYQALMPRHGAASGYDQVHVCSFCSELLNITASSRNQLKSLPLSTLRQYVTAYDIRVKGPIDKNDLVDAIIAAKTPTGTLPPSNESHYRTHGVPKHRSSRPRGLFSTRPPPPTQQQTFTPPPPDFPRPDLDPESAPYRTYTPNSTRQRQTPPTPPQPQPQPSPPQPQQRFRTASQPQTPPRSAPHFTPRPSPASTATPPPTRPSTASFSPPQPSTPQPPPPLSALLAMSTPSLSRLPIHTLKQILYEARVPLPADLLEKGELVARVIAWLEDERTAAEERDIMEREEREQEERERREREQQEERERVEAERSAMEAEMADSEGASMHESENVEIHDESHQHSPPPSSSPSPSLPRTTPAERSGLCVICQDQEANIAIMDCGHLAMCRACSDLVFASSRECPLCRTRIVTEARLIRIFKT